MKDYQRERVYSWEHTHLSNGGHVSYEDCQPLINLIWESHDLKGPPQIQRMPKQMKTAWADASRLVIRIPEEGVPMRVLLHEIAHSMTTSLGGLGDQHNSNYVGVYMMLLEKWMGMHLAFLWFTAGASGVDYDLIPKIRISDADFVDYTSSV